MEKLTFDVEEGRAVLPQTVKRLLNRIARHQRLLTLEAPSIILQHDQRLVTSAAVEFMGWVNDNVLAPSNAAINTQEDQRYRGKLAAHLRKHHRVLANADQSDEELHAMHEEACGGDPLDCETWITGEGYEEEGG